MALSVPEALKNAGRELLIALVLHSRATMNQADRRGWADTAIGGGGPGAITNDLRTLLLRAAGRRSDAKALNLYATALEIDSVAAVPKHQAIAGEIAKHWRTAVERYPRTLEHAKLNLVRRFGEAARAIADRRSQPDDPTKPAYSQLFAIGCAESSYPVRLAVAHEIGSGGDDALAQLKGLLGPDPANCGPVQAAAMAGRCRPRPTARPTSWPITGAEARPVAGGPGRATRRTKEGDPAGDHAGMAGTAAGRIGDLR